MHDPVHRLGLTSGPLGHPGQPFKDPRRNMGVRSAAAPPSPRRHHHGPSRPGDQPLPQRALHHDVSVPGNHAFTGPSVHPPVEPGSHSGDRGPGRFLPLLLRPPGTRYDDRSSGPPGTTAETVDPARHRPGPRSALTGEPQERRTDHDIPATAPARARRLRHAARRGEHHPRRR